ncbi:hypothetical protein [Siphonobacter sp. SORGH_AS_0500]|uniref:hypothetical protein n=1 Tax=Siphonobacter sp. SORGH_AS_0500 TaxID=1864824 RepID=UPI0028605BC5|nr:hypothetical protein [Siphonobacter sp. SORGH_AS_0500]MDR6193304.1 hypothetical protein [Siphonobacter sp. SORGH_AS_0500]
MINIKHYLLICFWASYIVCFAQANVDTLNIEEAYSECGIVESYKYESVSNLNSIEVPFTMWVNKTLKQLGIDNNIYTIYQSSSVRYASAGVDRKQPYFKFNPELLLNFNEKCGSTWAIISIIFHEINHHFTGDYYRYEETNEAIELRADYFSGFQMRKLSEIYKSITEQDAIAAISTIADDNPKNYPSKQKRIDEIKRGWKNGNINYISKNSIFKNIERLKRNTIESLPRSILAHAKIKASTSWDSPYLITTDNIAMSVTPKLWSIDNGYFNNEFLFENKLLNIIDKPVDVFYISNGKELIYKKNNQETILGIVVNSNNTKYPYLVQDNLFQKWYIDNNGFLLDSSFKKIGNILK